MDASHKDDFRSLAVGNKNGGSSTNPVIRSDVNVAAGNSDGIGVVSGVREQAIGQYRVVPGSANGSGVGINPVNNDSNNSSSNSVGVDSVVGSNNAPGDVAEVDRVIRSNGALGGNIGENSAKVASNDLVMMNQGGSVNDGLNNGMVEDWGRGTGNSVDGGVNGRTEGKDVASNALIGSGEDGGSGTNGSFNSGGAGASNEDLAIANELVASMGYDSGDIMLNQTKKKRTKLIVGIAIVVVCVVVGLVLFLNLGLSMMEPETGDTIRAKNYQEAFNIYANYFLFGERSKKTIDWDAVKEEGFVSYFGQVVDRPYEVESIASGQENVGDVIAKMDVDYDVFWEMFTKQEDRLDAAMSMVENYGKRMKFMNKYYNVGVPGKTRVLEKYIEGGYDNAEKFVFDLADKYEEVGTLYGFSVPDLIRDLGYNQISVIELYRGFGCVDNDNINYECVYQKGDVGDAEYLQKIAQEYDHYSLILYNVRNSIGIDLFELSEEIIISHSGEGGSR